MSAHLTRQASRDDAVHGFGALLARLRSTTHRKLKQKDVVALLPGWTTGAYSRLELGVLSPRFEQLAALYVALQQAGLAGTADIRRQFVELARQRIAIQQTHKDLHTDEEWAQLRFELARVDGEREDGSVNLFASKTRAAQPLLLETAHLLGREAWREQFLAVLQEQQKKLLVIRGPAGMGKSSELNWLASWLFRNPSRASHVMLCDLRSEAFHSRPEDALDLLLGSVLSELNVPNAQLPTMTRDELLLLLFRQLEHTSKPVVIVVDHGECLLQERGLLAPCWQRFITSFLRRQHPATLLLATTQWPGWFGGEHLFVADISLPPLSRDSSLQLLHQHGLASVPVALLNAVYEAVGGIPLCLEWVAALVKQPHFLEDWEVSAHPEIDDSALADLKLAVQRLLAEPHVFGGALSGDIAPLLERIITQQHLSLEARHLLEVLSIATLPLAKPALRVLCPEHAPLIKELRRASLLAAYPDRVQLLPMVAAATYRQLAPKQIHEHETLLLKAYKTWRREGTFHKHEEGRLIAEHAMILLKHGRLLDAARFLIGYGWHSANAGYSSKLVQSVAEVIERNGWRATIEQECGGLLLHHFYSQFSSSPVDLKQREADYRYVQEAILTEKVAVGNAVEAHVVHILMHSAICEGRFLEALAILDAQQQRLEVRYPANMNAHMFLQEKYALLLSRWSEYAEVQGDIEQAKVLRARTIAIRKQCIAFLEEQSQASTAKDLRWRLARNLTSLSYHLNHIGAHEEALCVIERSIALQEQGYTIVTGLAESYGEKSQTLMSLGRFQEAVHFDERAIAEVQHVIDMNYQPPQEEAHIYSVNRGLLYLRLGRVEEAERLLQEALPYISEVRRIYRMLAKETLAEIELWKRQTVGPQHQLDWRWLEQYRELGSYDAYWWWGYTGPFTQEEQQEWEQQYSLPLVEATKMQLGKLLVQARQREVTAALDEQREPRFHYPALEIDEMRRRINGMLALDAQIQAEEPNVLVCRLYHGAIEIEVAFLRMIEATYEGDNEKFMAYSRLVNPAPTAEEMEEPLAYVRQCVRQGLRSEDTRDAAEKVLHLMEQQLHLPFDLAATETVIPEIQPAKPSDKKKLSAQATKRFYETVLRDCGYDGWQVIIDPQGGIRVDSALRHLYLSDKECSLERIRELLAHELAGHAARAMAGERSLLGLLAFGTKYYQTTDEGLAQYYQRQVAALHGQEVEIANAGLWHMTLYVGLACGVVTPPQTFLSLFTFIEALYTLRRLLKRWDKNIETTRTRARRAAINSCLRAFLGVPNFEQAGICYTHDIVYQRGLRQIERAVTQDATILDRLMVGKTSLEDLPDLQALGIVPAPQPLRDLANSPDLDTYILSFAEQAEEQTSPSA